MTRTPPLRLNVRQELMTKVALSAERSATAWALEAGVDDLTMGQVKELRRLMSDIVKSAFADGYRIGTDPSYSDES